MKYLHTFKSRGLSDIPHRTFGDCRQEQNDHGICREEQIHGGTSTALARRGCQISICRSYIDDLYQLVVV
jgi:hypothetical protein